MTSTGCDRRGTSFAAELDAAIERVVAHFEENDVALRLDALRSLSAHAKLAFEAERVRERLRQHPATKDLVERVGSHSPVFEQLVASLRVDDVSCDYDARRNAVMATTLRWSLPAIGGGANANGGHKKKRRKGVDASGAADVPVLMRYVFERSQTEESETEVKLTVTVEMGDDGTPSEFVHFAMTSAASYPRSFYEETRDMESDEEEGEQEEEEEGVEEVKPSRKQSDDSEKKNTSKQNGGAVTDEEEADGDDGEEEEGESYGEAIVAFRFDDKVLDALMTWLRTHDTKYADEIDPADVIGFFLAPPVYEDEWLLDERICEILFSSGTESGDDEEAGEHGSEEGGDDDVEEEGEEEEEDDQ